MDNGTLWELEPHTKAKHEILKSYLGAWFPILASYHRRILYVDGFAGPGEYKGGEPGSPIIALEVARDHNLKKKLHRSGMDLVYYFIEKDEKRLANLRKKIEELNLPSNFKVATECSTFERAFGTIIKEIVEQGKGLAPSFVFIDPFGPTGFPMSLIKLIAQQKSSEVLINFNYTDLNRWFLQDFSKYKHLDELYGSNAWRQALNILDSNEKEGFLRRTYQGALENLGWKVRPFRMINKQNQTQYYLFFATSNHLGMLAMKQAMWSAAPLGDFKYSDLTNPNQACLFENIYDGEYSQQLADQIYGSCKGQKLAKEVIIKNEVAWHPICIRRHLTKALNILEVESKPSRIVEVEVPNRSRRKNSYPDDCTITFTK